MPSQASAARFTKKSFWQIDQLELPAIELRHPPLESWDGTITESEASAIVPILPLDSNLKLVQVGTQTSYLNRVPQALADQEPLATSYCPRRNSCQVEDHFMSSVKYDDDGN